MAALPEDKVFLDEPWVTIRWDSAHDCVHSEWKAFANSVEFRAALMQGVQAVKETGALGYLSDTRKIKLIVHEDQKWIDEVWAPLMLAAGLKRMALVTAAMGLGKMTVEESARMVDSKESFLRTFDSVAGALKWLAEAR